LLSADIIIDALNVSLKPYFSKLKTERCQLMDSSSFT